MAAPAVHPSDPGPPSSDPQAIRRSLPPTLVAEFDDEWEFVLDQVKQSKDLTAVYDLLNKWRHTAYLELRDPGAYRRMLAKADEITRTGGNPDATSFEELQSLIRQRLGA